MQLPAITITTTDREISYAIWELQSPKITIEESMKKAFPAEAKEIFIFVKDVATLTAALIAIIKAIKPVKEKNKSDASISIQLSNNNSEITQIIVANKGEIDIKIENK